MENVKYWLRCVALVVALFCGAGVLFVACGDDDTGTGTSSSDDVDNDIRFIRTTDPQTGVEYVCLWRYKSGANKAGAGMWCERVEEVAPTTTP